LTVVALVAVAVTPVGTDGGVVSGWARVVAVTTADRLDKLFALSRAAIS
jgi:hypothetical protein